MPRFGLPLAVLIACLLFAVPASASTTSSNGNTATVGTVPWAIGTAFIHTNAILDLITANDGASDLAVASSGGDLRIFHGDGNGNFSASLQSPIALGGAPGRLA